MSYLDPVTEAELYTYIDAPPPVTRADIEAMVEAAERWRGC